MVCCVLTAALLAMVGRFFRRITGRGDEPVAPKRPPAPTRVLVSAEPQPEAEPMLAGADV